MSGEGCETGENAADELALSAFPVLTTQDAAGSVSMDGEGYGQGEDAADELAELLNEMLPSESSAAAATAKGAAAAVINAAYARSTGADANSKARIARAATNPQARPLASQRPSTRAGRRRSHGQHQTVSSLQRRCHSQGCQHP